MEDLILYVASPIIFMFTMFMIKKNGIKASIIRTVKWYCAGFAALLILTAITDIFIAPLFISYN